MSGPGGEGIERPVGGETPGGQAASGGAGGPRPAPSQPYRPRPQQLTRPRRVRGGLKLKAREGDPLGNWIGQRLMRVVEEGAAGDAVREGVEYGRLGQTRRIELVEGSVEASVQGRRQRAYTTVLRLHPFTPEQREAVIAALAEQSRYAAKLLAGELPANVEDLFAPLGLRLFPASLKEFDARCDCKEERRPWCKHAVCAAAMLAERMSDDPFMIFALRGLPGDILIDALRQHRSMAGAGVGPMPVYLSHVPGASDVTPEPLEAAVDRFWQAAEPVTAELAVVAPEVGHAILRRLGPSPFTESRFRLVGLLATCYDLIGEHALREHGESAGQSADTPDDADDDGF